jgi:hypothetical protein
MFKYIKGYTEFNGTSLQGFISKDAFNRMSELFEVSFSTEADRGYDGKNWVFVGPGDMVYNIYTRWGTPRVGSWNRPELDIRGFEDWIMTQ